MILLSTLFKASLYFSCDICLNDVVGYLQKDVCSALGLCLHHLGSNWAPEYEHNKCFKTVRVVQHCRHLRCKTAHLHIFANTGQQLFVLIWTDDLPRVEAHLKLAFDGRIPVVLHCIVRPGKKYYSMRHKIFFP